jgi:hypothetical protein
MPPWEVRAHCCRNPILVSALVRRFLEQALPLAGVQCL